jgi:hypothetical protein
VFRRHLFAIVGTVMLLSSCTLAQIAQLQQMRGPITEADQATLVAMPDAPIRVGTQVIELDGSVVDTPEELLTASERFDLAYSRTSWATRPELREKLWCIAGRETGGTYFPRAHNGRGADNSYGWLQINMKGSLGPSRMAAFGLSSYEDLFDPEVNLEAGWALFQAAGWSPWASTHRPC